MARVSSKNGRVKDRPDRKASRAAAASAVPRITKSTLELKNGIVLSVRPVPQFMLRDAVSRLAAPTPPMWHNEQRGEDEPNPNDPDYIKAVEEHTYASFLAAGKAAMVLGLACLSVPDGYYKPEDDEWLEWVRFSGGEPDVSSAPARFLSWLEYHALRAETDMSAAIMAPLMLASMSEEDVARAVSAFRRGAERTVDSDASDEEPDQDGDRVPVAVSGDSA